MLFCFLDEKEGGATQVGVLAKEFLVIHIEGNSINISTY